MVVDFSRRQVKSTTDTSMVGTRNAIPVSFPWRDGMTLVTALAAPVEDGMTLVTAFAAPVEDGMMFPDAARPPRQSFLDEESTTACVVVIACTVVIRASSMVKASLIALTIGARPLVVQEAQETKFSDPSYSSWLTPMTIVWESSF